MNIYVGNLSYTTSEDDLRKAFEAHGQVDSARIVIDKYTNQSRGFGFVEMANNAEGQAAIDALNGANLGGRDLKVNEARPRENARQGGGRGFGGGGRGFGGGGRRDY